VCVKQINNVCKKNRKSIKRAVIPSHGCHCKISSEYKDKEIGIYYVLEIGIY
jgi:hypothetical protein